VGMYMLDWFGKWDYRCTLNNIVYYIINAPNQQNSLKQSTWH